jgi:hypothetical protein
MPLPSERPLTAAELRIVELLVLRHLYDGDLLDYPLPHEHPDWAVFDALEQRGWIARWDRIWPLRDRYRLTEAGIAEIERHYQAERGEELLGELRAARVPAEQRRRWLRDRGVDDDVWPELHDPHTHWESVRFDGGPLRRWVDEVAVAASPRPAAPEPPERDAVEDLDRGAWAGGAHHDVHDLPYGDVS